MKTGIPLTRSAGEHRQVSDIMNDDSIPDIKALEQILELWKGLVYTTHTFPEDWGVQEQNKIKALQDGSLIAIEIDEGHYCYYTFQKNSILTIESYGISYDTDDLKSFDTGSEMPLR